MRRRARAAAVLAALALAGAAAAPARGTVTLLGPPGGDTLPELTPLFTIQAAGFAAEEGPLALTLQAATSADFVAPVAETTVVVPAGGEAEAALRLARPLPALATLFFRARARTAQGAEVLSPAEPPRVTPAWLRLVSPNDPNGVTVDTRRPTFVWSSGRVSAPPGPWRYQITIRNVATGRTTVVSNLLDTVYVPPFDLESNTSYRWSVLARLPEDSAREDSRASFVIVDAQTPPATLLYQNFPNPFPSATRATTCIWFDLAQAAAVTLDIHDLRGNLVRRLLPTPGTTGLFAPGRYGRGSAGDPSCDPAFAWDGTGANGRVVPAGVYLARLRANGVESVKKILFRGR